MRYSWIVSLFILLVGHTGHAQTWIKLEDFLGPGSVVGITHLSSLPSGTVTFQEGNHCPRSYGGGQFMGVSRLGYDYATPFSKAKKENGEIMMLWPAARPAIIESSGQPVNSWPYQGTPAEYREFGQTFTITELFTPAVYFYGLSCNYADCGGSLCSVNLAHFFVFNIDGAPSTSELNLKVDKISILESQPTADGNFSVSPDKNYEAVVKVSATGLATPEARTAVLRLEAMGFGKSWEKVVNLSELVATGKADIKIPVTFAVAEAGELYLKAHINPMNSPMEGSVIDNILDQKMYVLCNVEDKGIDVPDFRQGGSSPWANDDYANQAPQKMRSLGCYTTSFAMLMRAYGIDKSADGVSAIDPGSVNIGLGLIGYYSELGPNYAGYGGYTSTGAVHPIGAVNFARASYSKSCIVAGGVPSQCKDAAVGKISFISKRESFNIDDRKELHKQLCAGNPVILKVPSLRFPNDVSKAHFVLANGMSVIENGMLTYSARDPANNVNNQNTTVNYDASKIRGLRIYRQISDPAMISFRLSGGVNMIVTDPLGRRSGFDPRTGQFFNEIVDGSYSMPESIDSPEENVSTAPEASFETVAAIDGQYRVQIFGSPNKSATYRLTRYSFDESGNINAISDQRGNIMKGQSAQAEVSHISSRLSIRYAYLKIKKSLFFDTRRKDKALVSGKIDLEDSKSISKIEKFVTVQIGQNTKTIIAKKMKKIKIGKHMHYVYLAWGRGEIAFDINVDTGDFLLYVDNINLDDSKPLLKTNIDLQIDDIHAEDIIVFKDVKKRKGK